MHLHRGRVVATRPRGGRKPARHEIVTSSEGSIRAPRSRSAAVGRRRARARSADEAAAGVHALEVDRVEDRAHLLVGDRVARAVVPGIDRERDADHLAGGVHERAARVARRERGGEDEHVPPARTGAVDVGADRDDLLADVRGAARNGPPPGARRRRRRRRRRRLRAAARRVRPCTREHGEVAHRVERDDARRVLVAGGVLDGGLVLPRDDVRVGHDEPARR